MNCFFAGGYPESNTNAWIKDLDDETYLWTMSPDGWYSSYPHIWTLNNGINSNYGKLISERTLADFTTKTIPVLSLKSCVKYASGDGSSTNPYTVTVDDDCANKEN